MSKLLIVGTVAFDAIETPFGQTDKILGGAATFIGLAAAQFNIDTSIVSVVGDDFPQKYLDLLSNRNIDISGVKIVKGGKTFFWKGKYHNDMNSRDTLVTELNVLADFNPVVPTYYKNAEVVMLGHLHPIIQLGVLEQMETFIHAVHSGEWRGASGEMITDIINDGIGGSDLGPKMAAEALTPYKAGKVNVHFLSPLCQFHDH